MDSNEVKLHFLDYWRVIRVRWALITLVFLLVLVSTGVTVIFLPREFFAQVSMEVRSDDNKVNPMNGGPGQYYNAQFVATQFQILRKTEILYPVIDNLGLVKTMSDRAGRTLQKQEVFLDLVNNLALEEVRNTSIIEVGVWDTDGDLARDIANQIAVVYRNKRLEDLQVNLDRALSQFQDEVTKQRKLTAEMAQEMARIRLRDNISDPDMENANAPLAMGSKTADITETGLTEQRFRVNEIENSLKIIEGLKPTELLNVLKDLKIEDPTVVQNLPELQRAVVEEANLLNGGLGENHPRVKALRARKVALNRILADALDTIRRTRATTLAIEKGKLASMQEAYDAAQQDVIGRTNKSLPYVDAKTKYLQAKHVLGNAEDSLSKARMEKMIDIEPVKIRQRAERPQAPGVRRFATSWRSALSLGSSWASRSPSLSSTSIPV